MLLHESNQYPFEYVAHVDDKNPLSETHLEYYFNLGGFPTTFYDGGYALLVGGATGTGPYVPDLEYAGNRTVPDLDMITSVEWLGNAQIEVYVKIGYNTSVNVAPALPGAPTAPVHALPETPVEFTATTTDGDNDGIYYQWWWGNGDTTVWLGPYNSGDPCVVNYTFTDTQRHDVRVRSKDKWEYITQWSPIHRINIGCCLGIRGDVNYLGGDGGIDVSDLVFFVNFMFKDGLEPSCLGESDVDGSGGRDISDLVFLVNFVFKDGPQPPNCYK